MEPNHYRYGIPASAYEEPSPDCQCMFVGSGNKQFASATGDAPRAFSIFYVLEGQGEFEDAGTPTRVVKPGDLVMRKEGEWSRLSSMPWRCPWSVRYVGFRGDILARWCGRLLPESSTIYGVGHSAELLACFDELAGIMRDRRAGFQVAAEAMIYKLVATTYLLAQQVSEPRDQTVHALLMALQQSVHAPSYDIHAFCRRSGVPYSSLRRRFHRATGCSVLQYWLRLRMAEAQRLLLDQPDMRVSEVADSLNFGDNSYFVRWFKTQAGMTPTQFRQVNFASEQRPAPVR